MGALALLPLALVAFTAPQAVQARPRSRQVSVRIGGATASPPVPREFMGLSFEAARLPLLARLATRGDLVALLRSIGPGVIRFGGNSVDAEAAWSDDGHAGPSWAGTLIGPADLDGVARLARASGWRVLLAVNLGHYDPQAAAREVVAAQARLGGSLLGVEIGNEPDLYVQQHLRTPPWGYAQYRPQFEAYRQAIAAAAPGVPIVGPDISSARNTSWLSSFASAEHPSLLTAHYYPLTSCNNVPTLADLLSGGVGTDETHVLGALARLSAGAGIPLRLGETNNVSCRGYPGVSDTFGSALWAVDYLMRAIRAGVAGVNLHGLPNKCTSYAPLCARTASALSAGRLRAQPEWYALLLVHQLIGDRLLAASVSGAPSGVSVAALRSSRGRLHVVIVDSGGPVVVRLRVGRSVRSGTILRLTGRSVRARSGVKLGGRAVAPNGTWRPGRLPRVGARGGVATISLAGQSAALVTLR